MAFLFMLSALGILAAYGTLTAVQTATSPELDPGRRVVLWILAGLLALVTLLFLLLGYWLWDFTRTFSF